MSKEAVNQIEAIAAFISKCIPLIEDESNKEYFTKNLESIANAKDVMGDNEEKITILLDATTRWANQLAFLLFRKGALSDELAAEFRVFATPEETTAKVQEFNQARDAEIERIKGEQEVVMSSNRELDVFKAVIGGMSQAEAEKKLAEYEAAQNPQM